MTLTRVVNNKNNFKKEDVKQKERASTFVERTDRNRSGFHVSRFHLFTTSLLCSLRLGGRMSGSSVELDRCGQPGFGGSPLPASGGLLGSAGLPTASTDSLAADTSEPRSCS